MSDHVVCRDFKLTLVSATDVEHVRNFFKTKVYAAVTIGDNKATKKQTSTDKSNETNPKWNYTMEYTIAATDVQNPGLDLLIELYIDRSRGDKRVGHVTRPINELFHHSANNIGITRLNLPLVTEGGVTKGLVTLEYSFGEEKSVKNLSLVKKLVNAGTSMAVKATIMSSTGAYVPIPIHVFREPEIVCSKATAGAIFGEVVQNTSLTLPLVTDGGESKGVVTIEYSFGEEKSVKKLSFVKKLANVGISVAVKGAIMYTTGVYVPISIRAFRGPEIVCSKATASNEEFFLDVILEVVQYVF